MIFSKVTVVLLLALGGVQGRQVLFPSNTVAVVGSSATLQCAYQERSCLHVRWQKRNSTGHLTNISDDNTIYNRWKYNLNDASNCDLVILNVQLADFGTYVCAIAGSTRTFGIADLIVLQGQPSCSSSCKKNSTAEGDQVMFTCKLTGKGGGSMTWLDKRTMVEIKNVPNQIPAGDSLSRDFRIKAVAPQVPELVCLTRFYFNGEAGRATNVPYVKCETESCDIRYSVRNVLTWPLGYASPGEKITCKADGNPDPKFIWQWKENDGDDEWMNVPDETEETIEAFQNNETVSIKLRCVASNSFNDKSYREESPAVTVSKHGSAIRTGIIVGVVVGLIILAIIAGLVYFFVFN